MSRRPPRSTLTYTRVPYTPRFRSAELAADAVLPVVAGKDAVVQPVAEALLQAAEVGHRIVVVAVHHQQPATIGGGVHTAPAHLHRWQREAAEAAERAIVVAGDVDQPGTGKAQGVQRHDDAVVSVDPGSTGVRPQAQTRAVAKERE